MLDGDEWVINGIKAFITNSGTDITALVTVTAVTGAAPDGAKEISTIIVPSGTPGLHRARPATPRSAGAPRTPTSWPSTTVRVPAANLLGERGRGFAQFLRILDEGRIAIAALAVGLAQGCVDESVQVRQASGTRSASRSATTRRSSSRSPTWRCGRTPPGWPTTTRPPGCSPARTSSGRRRSPSCTPATIAVDNAREATQIHGGYGFMNEFPVARFWRDAKILEIGEGTSEVQRMIIARESGAVATSPTPPAP